MNSNSIGILTGPHPSLIDHLVPLCSMMEVPILVTDREVQEQIELFYPEIEVRHIEAEDHLLDLVPYDRFFYVHFYRTGNQTFFFNDYFCSHKARSVMSLHGHPDKFHDIYWIERLEDEDIVLAYGPALVELMRAKGVKKEPILTGNYRLEYYKQHKTFFDARLPFEKTGTTLLYAPTWASHNTLSEESRYHTSFFKVYEELFETLPEHFQLIVKLHPNHKRLMYSDLEKIQTTYPNIHFLDSYPPIYPLLNQIDIYIGDYSSVGYDFLYFDRPLVFLKTDEKTPLHTCGITIQDEPIYKTIESHLSAPFSEKRRALYRHVYGVPKDLKQLKKEIEHAF